MGRNLDKDKVFGVKWDKCKLVSTTEIDMEVNLKLVETMLFENGEMKDKEAHIQRMKNSAEELGFKFNPEIFNVKIFSDCILRILLHKDGSFETQMLPISGNKSNRVVVSQKPINSAEPLLYHKTMHRPWYKMSMHKIKMGEVYDEIFINEKGELTEGSRSNIVIEKEGKWFTPPVKCGLLNGVLRQKMLQDGKVEEKILYLDDLKLAEKIFCINSVRGVVEVGYEG